MFNARGVGVTKLPAGQYQVTVDFFADADAAKPVLTQMYVVVDRPALIALVALQLGQLKQASDDAQTNMSIVGKPLGAI